MSIFAARVLVFAWQYNFSKSDTVSYSSYRLTCQESISLRSGRSCNQRTEQAKPMYKGKCNFESLNSHPMIEVRHEIRTSIMGISDRWMPKISKCSSNHG